MFPNRIGALKMEKTKVIKQAGPENAQALLELIHKSFKEFTKDFRPTPLTWTIQDLRENYHFWLVGYSSAEMDEIIGAVRHHGDGEHYTFDSLCVKPNYRATGMGTALVRAVEEVASAQRFDSIHIALRDSLRQNILFFQNRGYQYSKRFGHAHSIYSKQVVRFQ